MLNRSIWTLYKVLFCFVAFASFIWSTSQWKFLIWLHKKFYCMSSYIVANLPSSKQFIIYFVMYIDSACQTNRLNRSPLFIGSQYFSRLFSSHMWLSNLFSAKKNDIQSKFEINKVKHSYSICSIFLCNFSYYLNKIFIFNWIYDLFQLTFIIDLKCDDS